MKENTRLLILHLRSNRKAEMFLGLSRQTTARILRPEGKSPEEHAAMRRVLIKRTPLLPTDTPCRQ